MECRHSMRQLQAEFNVHGGRRLRRWLLAQGAPTSDEGLGPDVVAAMQGDDELDEHIVQLIRLAWADTLLSRAVADEQRRIFAEESAARTWEKLRQIIPDLPPRPGSGGPATPLPWTLRAGGPRYVRIGRRMARTAPLGPKRR